MPQAPVPPDIIDIEQRFAAAGIVLAPERKAGAIDSAQAMLAAMHWLRRPRTAAAEPANTFSLVRAMQ